MKVKKTLEVPNPGSDEAIKKGCICAVLDNRHGLGAFDFGDGVFWITSGCPLHDPDGASIKFPEAKGRINE